MPQTTAGEPLCWYVLSLPRAAARIDTEMQYEQAERRRKGLPELRWFAPTYRPVAADGTAGRPRALLFNYVFLQTDLSSLLDFRRHHPDYNLLHSKPAGGDSSLLVVPDAEMDIFIRVAEVYQGCVPCYQPAPEEWQRGDKVRIVGGPFDGVEGIFLSSRGKETGRVVVQVNHLFNVPLLNVSPQQIRLLRFSDTARHLYDKLDSYAPRLAKAALQYHRSGELTCSSLSDVTRFVGQMGELEVPAGKARLRYRTMLALSHTLLRHTAEAARYVQLCQRDLEKRRPTATLAPVFTLLYAATCRNRYRETAQECLAAPAGRPLSQTQQATAALLEQLTALITRNAPE